MYDHDFYAEMDREVITALKSVVWITITGLKFLVLYILAQPIRLYEYIIDAIKTEEESQHETNIRFKRLKRYGHI